MSHDDTDTTVLDPEPADLLDEEWLAGSPRRSRWRIVLLAALGVAVVFLGGVEVQKHFGTSAAAPSAAAPGGFTPGGGLPEGFPDLAGGTPAGLPSSGAGDPQTSQEKAPSVIGTVTEVDGDTWVVTDLGGTKHTVTVTDDTTVLEEKSVSDARIAKGTTVTVTGSGDTDDLTASSITVR